MELVKQISPTRFRFDSTYEMAHFAQGRYYNSAEEIEHLDAKEEMYEIVCRERKVLYIGKWRFSRKGFVFSLVVYGLLALFLMVIVYWLRYS